MNTYATTKNRQLSLMLTPARERLKKYSVLELCRKGNIPFDEATGTFSFPSLGEVIDIPYPDFVIDRDLDMWHHLTILQYMDTADGTPLIGRMIGLEQMPGGLSRGRGYDKDIATMAKRSFVNVEAKQFRDACLRLGGEILEGRGDVCARIPYAPMFPVNVNFWEGDEEFAPSVKVLVDEAADHYLTIEAAGGACSEVVQRLIRLIEEER